AACAWLLAAAAPAPSHHAHPPDRVGRLTLHPCGDLGALCGRLERPLDPRAPEGRRIGIGFEYYRHRDRSRPALGLIVGAEGGPGYATTEARANYLTLFWPLMDRRDLLLMDNRGTGTSGAIDCRALQEARGQTVAAVGACGRSLGAAAALYGTGLAADDLAALLDALGAGQVDLYGDSYGTFFAQVFAGRHPDRLRSLVLDGAYPVIGEDPFYGAAGAAVRRTLDAACRRAPVCRTLPGTALERIGRLLDRLRAHPITAATQDIDGTKMTVTLDPPAIGNVLYDGTSGSLNLREIDAAARALLDADDPVPLLRLVAENIRTEGDGMPAGPPATYSRGLNAAVSCMDYPQLYDMTAPAAARRAQAASRIAAKQAADPGVYAPLTIADWQRLPLDISVLAQCENWPLPAPPYPPGRPVPPGAAYPAVPALVISGEMDILTTPEEGGIVARQFPAARRVVLANSFHVDAIGDTDDCASAIVRRFVASGGDPGDTACAAGIRPLRLPPGFPRHAGDMAPATPLPGNAASAAGRALAAAAVQTAGDALARWWLTDSSMPGLRGGKFSVAIDGDEVMVTLQALRWTEDLAVSGRVAWNQATGAVQARLRLSAADGRGGEVQARWNDRATDARATLSGSIGGDALAAETDAP
ncbi:MAG TPA: alpha/beta fold hydrolase, partial [Acetobacteraceae bacterium]|nr:alpha/beta fold hydrolase [Acetobacteraceae bacterium]